MDINISNEELIDILKILDTCCQRGSFKAVEMEGIGKLYNILLNKLNNFNKEDEENDKNLLENGNN